MQSWHRGTRFWHAAERVLVLTFLLAFSTLKWEPSALGEAWIAIGGIVAVIFGGSSAVKFQEKRNGS